MHIWSLTTSLASFSTSLPLAYSFSATWESLLLLSHIKYTHAWGFCICYFLYLKYYCRSLWLEPFSSFRYLLKCHFHRIPQSQSPSTIYISTFSPYLIFFLALTLYFLEHICSLIYWLSLLLELKLHEDRNLVDLIHCCFSSAKIIP